MPNATPVRILARPLKTRVAEMSMLPVRESEIMSGRRVPRSPREPEISARGCARSVLRLCLWTSRRWDMRVDWAMVMSVLSGVGEVVVRDVLIHVRVIVSGILWLNVIF